MWLAYVLFALFVVHTIICIARAAGWNPDPISPGVAAFCAVLNALTAVGIWVWLI